MIKYNFSNNDIGFNEKNNFKVNTYNEDTLQRIKFKVMLDRGEWFLNKLEGIPWTSEIVHIKKWEEQKEKIDKYMRNLLLGDKDVEEILSLDISLEESTRKFTVNFKVKCKNGEEIEMEVQR